MRGAAPAAGWLTDTEERPRAGAVSGAGIHRRARVFRAYVWAASVLTPFLLLATLAALTGSTASAPADATQVTSPGRAAATERILDWLAGPSPGLPGGRMLLWSGARTAAPPTTGTAYSGGDAALAVEVDAFVVVDGGGNEFTAEVQVGLDENGAATVLSGPSLTPLRVLDQAAARDAGPWPGRPTGQPTAPVTAAVRAWAAAFTSSDQAALRLVVGDPDPNRGYLPLTGVAAVETTVGPAAVLDRATQVVRVDLAVTWAAAGSTEQAASPPVGTTAAVPKITFDVLITAADTAAPRVVAWGGPGSGPGLTPFQNAVPTDPTTPAEPGTHLPATAEQAVPTFVPTTAGHGPAG
jgi:hypothetical protein